MDCLLLFLLPFLSPKWRFPSLEFGEPIRFSLVARGFDDLYRVISNASILGYLSRLIFYPIEWIYSNALIDIPRGAIKVRKNSGEIDRAIFFFLFFHPRKRETGSIAVYPKFVRLTSGE